MAAAVEQVKKAPTAKQLPPKTATRKKVTATRARRRTEALATLAPPPVAPAIVPRSVAGLEQILAKLHSISKRAALAYASADLAVSHKIMRFAQAGLREAEVIFKILTGHERILPQGQSEELVRLMNDIKLLGMQITDYGRAAVEEAWRREHDVGYEPHPLGHDDAEFIAQNVASRLKARQGATA